MGIGEVLEPLVVLILLFGGTWVNRASNFSLARVHARRRSTDFARAASPDSLESRYASPTSKDELLSPRCRSPSTPILANKWRKRNLKFLGISEVITTPDTAVFHDRLCSRLTRRLPFLMECWYWALIYWTYQLGRAFTAVTLREGTVDAARHHALQLIQVEERLGIFWELKIQRFFLRYPLTMTWINWTYSFIHIPGTIVFLVWLYHYAITRNLMNEPQQAKLRGTGNASLAGPLLYEARRRTLAVCNLLAFVVFTLWPCMPPRLLGDPAVKGPEGELARSYGFVDTVHGANGAGSVWTENRFCNQYAAMPSLHFGYSLIIGLTIATIPLPAHHRRAFSTRMGRTLGLYPPSWRRLICLVIGLLYPSIILVAIVATANHFILDAIAGAMVCVMAWQFNRALLNLLPVEDCFLWLVQIHKPRVSRQEDWESEETESRSATSAH